MSLISSKPGHILPSLAGVAGWPIHHSLSPLIHNTWLKNKGLDGGYTMFAVHPDEAVTAFKTLKNTSIKGLNVTIPLKALAYEAADIVSSDAKKLGVCNVLYTDGDKLVGHNTDMEGFASPLLKRIGHKFILNRTSVIIGAGGAARAVLGALLAIGAPEILIINRTDKRAESLVEQVNIPSLRAVPWDRRQEAIFNAGLIINATSGGMVGYPDLDVDLKDASADAVVYDLVYRPLVTGLLKQAAHYGLQTIGGLDMLVAQAKPSFRLFFGVDAPDDESVYQALKKELGN